MGKRPQELTACFLAVGGRIVSTHFACSASLSYDLLLLLSKHFEAFMQILLSPASAISGTLGWAEIHKVTDSFGLTAVLVLAPGSFDRGASHYWRGADMLHQLLQDFNILFHTRALLTHEMLGNPRVQHEEGVVCGLDILAMLSLPSSELLQATSIRELLHPLLKEQGQQIQHLQSKSSFAPLKNTTANRPLNIAEVQTTFALYLIAAIEGAHTRMGDGSGLKRGRELRKLAETTSLDRLRKLMDTVYKDNLGILYIHKKPPPAIPVPCAPPGPSSGVIVVGHSGTDKRLLPRQFVRAHHICASRDTLELVETAVHCLALANTRCLEQLRLGVIEGSEQAWLVVEVVNRLRQMVREMTQAIGALPEDTLKETILAQWLIHMQALRPALEFAFTNFFVLERTPFQYNSYYPDEKDFHDWGTDDVPHFVQKWDSIMRDVYSSEDLLRARNFGSPMGVERFASQEGKIYSTSLEDLDTHKDMLFPRDTIVIFHVPLAKLTNESLIQEHLNCLDTALRGMSERGVVLAILFEKFQARDFSSIRTRFLSRTTGHADKAIEVFDMNLTDLPEMRTIFTRCEQKRTQHEIQREQQRLEEMKRMEQEAIRIKEEEKQREEAIRKEQQQREEAIRKEQARQEEMFREATRKREEEAKEQAVREERRRQEEIREREEAEKEQARQRSASLQEAEAPEAPSMDAEDYPSGGRRSSIGRRGSDDLAYTSLSPSSSISSAPSLLDEIRHGQRLKKVASKAPEAAETKESYLALSLTSALLSRRMVVVAGDASDGEEDDWEDDEPKAETKEEKPQADVRNARDGKSKASSSKDEKNNVSRRGASKCAASASSSSSSRTAISSRMPSSSSISSSEISSPPPPCMASSPSRMAISPPSSPPSWSSSSISSAPPARPPLPSTLSGPPPPSAFTAPPSLPPLFSPPTTQSSPSNAMDLFSMEASVDSKSSATSGFASASSDAFEGFTFSPEARAEEESPPPPSSPSLLAPPPTDNLTIPAPLGPSPPPVVAGRIVAPISENKQAPVQAPARVPVQPPVSMPTTLTGAKFQKQNDTMTLGEEIDAMEQHGAGMGIAEAEGEVEMTDVTKVTDDTKEDYDPTIEDSYSPEEFSASTIASSVAVSPPPQAHASQSSAGVAVGALVSVAVLCCPCLTVMAPFYGIYWVGKTIYEKTAECCEYMSDRWKNRKKKASNIDDVFADMENVFNGLASCVLYCEVNPKVSKAPTHKQSPCCCFNSWNASSTLRCLFGSVPLLIIVYILVSAFAVSVLLPCIFVLLVVRTAKVERKVETGFAVRQQVLASETKAKKAMRGVSLLLRAIPMLGLVVAYPLVAVYLIAANDRDSAKLAIGVQLTLLAVLQVLGSVRGLKSWVEANKEKDQVRVVKRMQKLDAENDIPGMLPRWVQAVTDENADLGDEELRNKLALEPEPLANFRLTKPYHWWVSYGILMEGVQLAFFSVEFAPKTNGFNFTNAIYLRLNVFVPTGLEFFVESSAIYISSACVALLILLFCIQLIKEVRRFGLLKRSGDTKAANAFFFYSFVGAIIYGHGEVRGVHKLVSLLAGVLSDALFLIVASHLLSALLCTPLDPVVASTQCWEGGDLHRAALALVALSFYVPLCVMIGPMLSEATEEPSKPQPPSVKLAQPFLSVIAVSKFFLLLFASYFAQGTSAATKPVLALAVCLMVFLVLLGWVFRSGSTLFPAKSTQRVPGLQVPINPPSLFIWRALCYAAGVWGAVSALVVIGVDNWGMLVENSPPSEQIKGLVFFIGLGIIFLVGLVWWMRWQARDRVQRHYLATLALMLQGKMPINAEVASFSSSRKIPVTTPTLKQTSKSPFDADCLLVDELGTWSVLSAN